MISFIVAAIACCFAALAYAEFSSTIPVAGSIYTYSYATLGELAAWIIGWDLMLEYGLATSAVSVGWSGYLQSLLSGFGIWMLRLRRHFDVAPHNSRQVISAELSHINRWFGARVKRIR